ncbi:S4 domain-containing protein YaaA [Jeotgalicoccus huakuii]|nr:MULTISPECIES: S4 domain-containing protein YaaA [Jeotgalicoccus]MCK1977539.1 S4 domain-containing protein YaaA [Jeotgalicoccus huakuii]QQD84495.1 S4 domain-containing protein YaaA [Jeotgalicoccus sp. ATCC 8456]
MSMETIHLNGLITLGQFLKHQNIIGTGGQAKWFLSENIVFLNGEEENRRGKKLHDGDELVIEGIGEYKIKYTDQ